LLYRYVPKVGVYKLDVINANYHFEPVSLQTVSFECIGSSRDLRE